MGSVATLPLDTIVDVNVVVSPQAPATPQFNQGLIVGTSNVIGSVTGTNQRLRQYTSLAQIAADGFSLTSPEYIAASIYLAQSPAPVYIWIGRQDLSAIQTLILGLLAPTGVVATPSTTGGTLAAGNYFYKITALDSAGETTASIEVEATTTGSTGSVALTWTAEPGATSYRIYKGTATGAQNGYFTSASANFTDTGASDTAGTVPTTNTTGIGGTGYVVGDLFTVTQGSAQLGTGQVTSVGAGGTVTGVSVVQGRQGTAYSTGNNLPTVALTGVGTGLEVSITAIGETPLQAMQACRLASPQWYLSVSLPATDADHIAIGEWAQSQTPQLVYFYTTSSAASLNGTTGNVFSILKAGNYSRAFGIYSTTQGGLFPNNIYAAVAAMGVAMGLNTGLANSYFTMKFKVLTGIGTEPLTPSQILTIENNNGNVYLSYANTYSFLEQGKVASGQFFDEVLQLDMLASDYQYSLTNLLTSRPAVLQNDAGQSQILNVVNAANARAALRGFISQGIWEGNSIIFPGSSQPVLQAGQALPNGYGSYSDKYSNQSASDRAARKSMPVYVAIIESGAVHSILIGVTVQQ